jgi:oxepin-CoA hydrolase / 3-oxo-5,6-dehydrosuberyl-CoA semialdehyde dehydrogenase
MKCQSYASGQWVESLNLGKELLNASTGEVIGSADSTGVDFAGMLDYGRKVGNSNLRSLTFHERGRRLKALALHLLSKKEEFYKISYMTGATKIDSWIDIEGGIGNLFAMSSKARRELPDDVLCLDGATEMLSKEGSFIGQHIYRPKSGCAIHINAFNFPIWGMLEKIAVNLVAGVPAIVKPATLTSYLTYAVVKEILASQILPEGALQLICGSVGDLLDHVDSQDVVTFTGSASTGKMLKAHPRIIDKAVPFNMEADSLNASLLGPDATPETEEFKIFIKEVAREMTVKAGQKCTAIRRAIVPEHLIADVEQALKERLKKTIIGNPEDEKVRMGPLAGPSQLEEVQERVAQLSQHCELLYQGDDIELMGNVTEKGSFMKPTLLYCKNPFEQTLVHDIEAFGPVSTLIPYKNTDEAIELANLGKGSLVSSVVSADNHFVREVVLGTSHFHGRMVILNKDCAKESTGHGSPLPNLVHGGPGRAGGGEEMGGLRGVYHYMQRTALQGHPSTLSKVTNHYLPGAATVEKEKHPFRHYFEELEIGQSLLTHKRTVTEADIVNFANVSWDHFYAHTDDTSFDGTLFEGRVAHGYFIISAAAGLFVDPGKGPVLANYGVDELRFIKPVYVGDTIQVRLTCKEKMAQDPREDETPRGVVKWLVDVKDQDGESVALGTILTLVAKKA